MAKKEEAAAYINYETGSGESEHLGRYFLRKLRTERGIGAIFGSAKEWTLAKRVTAEYGIEDAKQLVDHWIKTAHIDHVHKFNYFYQNRQRIAEKLFKPKDYGWS